MVSVMRRTSNRQNLLIIRELVNGKCDEENDYSLSLVL